MEEKGWLTKVSARQSFTAGHSQESMVLPLVGGCNWKRWSNQKGAAGRDIGPVAQSPRAVRQCSTLCKARKHKRRHATAQSIRTFRDFAVEDWSPVVLPTLKYATQKHYNYMLNVHLIPAFGARQLRDIRRGAAGFLSRKLASGCPGKP